MARTRLHTIAVLLFTKRSRSEVPMESVPARGKTDKSEDESFIDEATVLVDEELEDAVTLYRFWIIAGMPEVSSLICITSKQPQYAVTISSDDGKKEVRVPNACFEHKSRHQKCPKECPNRIAHGKRSAENIELEELNIDTIRRGKRHRKPRYFSDTEQDL